MFGDELDIVAINAECVFSLLFHVRVRVHRSTQGLPQRLVVEMIERTSGRGSARPKFSLYSFNRLAESMGGLRNAA